MTDAPAAQAGLTMRIEVSPAIVEAGRAVRWVLIVTNNGKNTQSLTFPTSQRGEIVLETDAIEWYRWGDHRLFLPGQAEKEIPVGATWQCVLDDILRIPTGWYQLHATVTADPQPPVVHKHLQVHQPARRPAAHRPHAAGPTSSLTSGQVRPVLRATNSPPSATLYGRCRKCQSPRVLRTNKDDQNLVHSYDIACTRCGESEPLRRPHRS